MELYHLLNRGVEKRDIVLDDRDRARFVHDLFAFNDLNLVQHISQPTRRNNNFSTERNQLVDIHAFCLMNNHYHLLVSARKENGIPIFMKKLNMGYAKYFNERYERVGTLWQGKYKKILIEREAHYLYIPYYIHLNPLDYFFPEWRSGTVKNVRRALLKLREYRWSSHLDYVGAQNFPSVISRRLLHSEIGSGKRYEDRILSLMQDPKLTAESYLIEN